jgi:hypothetical protein
MAKTPSDKLHRLIRSLSSAERRYFKIFIRGKTDRDSKYLQMFEVLANMVEYDSLKVRKIIYGKQDVDSKKYPELKSYLYDLILKSFQSYDESNSVEGKLSHYLRSVSSLFKRGHYDDCETQLAKAQKLAAQYELFTWQLDIYKWYRHLAYTRMDVQFLHTQLDLLDQEESQILDKLNNLTTYRKLFFRMYALIKKDAFQRDANRMDILKKMIPEALLEAQNPALSNRGIIMYYRTVNLYHYAAQDIEKFYLTGQKTIQIIENQPFFLEENQSEYIASLSNYILACGLKEQYNEVREALQKLRLLVPRTEDDRRKIHRQYYSSMFLLCQFTGEFEDAQQELIRCKEEAELLHSKDYETASFFFQYFYISFGCGNYEQALEYLNVWLSQPRSLEREDLQSLARILALLLHYELGNMLLLESLIRSTKRFLRQKNRLYELEKKFIQLMSDLMRAPNAAEKKKAIVLFEESWVNIAGTNAINQIFDLKSWIDAQISGKSYGETVREKWRGRGA